MVLFTKESMDADKPGIVVNLSTLRFIGDPKKQGITVNIKVAWYLERSVDVINKVGLPVEEYLDRIGMKSRKVVILMECDGKVY